MGGASFLRETYGIRQEFGPPRFKKTNKGKIVREAAKSRRAAALPSALTPGRPGPGGAEQEAGGSPGWSPVGFPALGLAILPSPSAPSTPPGGPRAPGEGGCRRRRRRRSACLLQEGHCWSHSGHPPASRQTPAEPSCSRPKLLPARIGGNPHRLRFLWGEDLPLRSPQAPRSQG